VRAQFGERRAALVYPAAQQLLKEHVTVLRTLLIEEHKHSARHSSMRILSSPIHGIMKIHVCMRN
jgi:hypothetical protein